MKKQVKIIISCLVFFVQIIQAQEDEPVQGHFSIDQVTKLERLESNIYKLFDLFDLPVLIDNLSHEDLELLNQTDLQKMEQLINLYGVPEFLSCKHLVRSLNWGYIHANYNLFLHSFLTMDDTDKFLSAQEVSFRRVLFMQISIAYALENHNYDFIKNILQAGVSGNGALISVSNFTINATNKRRYQIYGLKMLHLAKRPQMIDLIVKEGKNINVNCIDSREMGAIEYYLTERLDRNIYKLGEYGGIFYPSTIYPNYRYLRTLGQ